jgi:hemolysin activation/secretion protein
LRAQAFGLVGTGDLTTASIYSTADVKEQKVLQLTHSFRPGSEGLTVDGLFTYAWSRPDLDLPSIVPDLKARTLFASLGARYPVTRSQSTNLWIGGGLDFLNQTVSFFGPQSEDRLRIAFLRANWDAVDLRTRRPKWRTGATLELRRGIDIFNASERCPNNACPLGVIGPSRGDGDPTATVIRGAAQGEVAIGDQVALAVLPRAQLAMSALPSFEEFTAGNYTVGRGYEPATITGDSGAGVSLELRGPRLSSGLGALGLQPYVFGDAVWTWNKHVAGDPEHLKSAGGGVRADIGDRFRIDAALAVPLERAGLFHRRGDPRLLVTLTSRILPWRS